MRDFATNVTAHVLSGYQVMSIETIEEQRCETELCRIAFSTPIPERLAEARRGRGGSGSRNRNRDTYRFVTWDIVRGFTVWRPDENNKPIADTANPALSIINPVEAMQAIPNLALEGDNTRPAFFVFRDLAHVLGAAAEHRALRNLVEEPLLNSDECQRPLFLLNSSRGMPTALAASITALDFALPDVAQLTEMVNKMVTQVGATCDNDLRHRVVTGLRGLTDTEASNCLALCLRLHRGMSAEVLTTIETTKANVLKGNGILTYVSQDQLRPVEEIGGYESLKEYVRLAGLAYSPQAEAIKIDKPKGMVLVGVPGTGKSVVTEAIAAILQLPVVNFDFSAVFNSLVGESEKRVRETIKVVEALGGCVLVIDEADKALAGSGSSTVSDGGVTKRVFGQLLTWLARKQDRTFVVVTMNSIEGIPDAFLRRGRFDEIWWVGLPSENERKTIMSIHMRKRNVDPDIYSSSDWMQFTNASKDMVGSELEEVVKMARLKAFQADTSGPAVPTKDQILGALATVEKTKLTKVSQDWKAIQEFGENRGRSVSESTPVVATTGPKGKASRHLDIGKSALNN